ncbi:MAG TPA: hypothetical protein VEP50_07570 [bacterium]|nr:hypothetical protein [bacterium]
MPIDNDRNRILMALRERPPGAQSRELADALGFAQDVVERHLQYCVDYALATWKKKDGTGLAVITDRGRDYLSRQGL